MNVGVLIIGDEILSGRRQDRHLVQAIDQLKQRGMRLHWAQYLGDEPDRITAALRQAFASGDLVFSFGGIGSTPDDHTRACAAAALGEPLQLHPQARELILQRIAQLAAEQGVSADPHSEESQRRLDMGRFPASARIIPNPYNQIPGFACGHVHFLPGFPVMAWPMMAAVLDGPYAHLHGTGALVERAAVVRGAMESTLTPLMQEVERRFTGVKVFSLPSVDDPQRGRHIELGVKGGRDEVEAAFAWMLERLPALGATFSTETGH